MIKVEHTRTYQIGNPIKNQYSLVTDAELVLVEYMTAALPNCIIDTTNLCIDGKCYKPILISRTEKIEVGDWYLSFETNYATEPRKRWVVYNCVTEPNGSNPYKILALPEHFSLEQLAQIVSGELKDGQKVLLEVERI